MNDASECKFKLPTLLVGCILNKLTKKMRKQTEIESQKTVPQAVDKIEKILNIFSQ
jgi:hypothetical protein